MCLIIMCKKYQGGKFLKKLWYCVGGEYHKKILRNGSKLQLWNSLRWSTQIINLVDKTKFILFKMSVNYMPTCKLEACVEQEQP